MVSPVTPELDYLHLPDRPDNPLMESSLHSRWGSVLVSAIRHTLSDAGSDSLATGNVPFVPAPNQPHTAPDLMVVAGMRGKEFRRYSVGLDGPPPLVCIEIRSKRNSNAVIERRLTRWLNAGVGEVYLIEPEPESIERWQSVEGQIERTDPRGVYSPGMNATFATINGRLSICCPAGRVVGVDDDSYQWLAMEQRRADRAESELSTAREHADSERERANSERERADRLVRQNARLLKEIAALHERLA